MTREEAIIYLKQADVTVGRDIKTKTAEALEMAIKALEQEPTYTSQIAQKAYEDGKKDGYVQVKLEQEPKTGHQIDINNHHYYNDGDIETTELRCSCCNKEVEWDIELLHKPYYCENCGCRMVEPQESK